MSHVPQVQQIPSCGIAATLMAWRSLRTPKRRQARHNVEALLLDCLRELWGHARAPELQSSVQRVSGLLGGQAVERGSIDDQVQYFLHSAAIVVARDVPTNRKVDDAGVIGVYDHLPEGFTAKGVERIAIGLGLNARQQQGLTLPKIKKHRESGGKALLMIAVDSNGEPSTAGGFDTNHWIYFSGTTKADRFAEIKDPNDPSPLRLSSRRSMSASALIRAYRRAGSWAVLMEKKA